MIQRRFLLLMLLLIAGISAMSFVSLFLYLDPYTNTTLAIILVSVSFFLLVSSLLGVILYFFKKIYFRGDVGVYNVITSVRQAAFISAYIMSLLVFLYFEIPLIFPLIALFFVVTFLELFIQSLHVKRI